MALAAVEKMDFRRSSSIITQRQGQSSMPHLSCRVPWISGDRWIPRVTTDLPDIKRCSCWAHVRRYSTDAIPKGKKYDYSLPAVQGGARSKLFDCERYSKAKNHTAEQRKQFRLEKEKPIWRPSGIGWINSVQIREPVWRKPDLPKIERHPDDLSGRRHCSYPIILARMQSDHSLLAENWLFSASPKGAASSAIVIQWLRCHKANDLNTYKYLTYLLSQRPDAKMSDEQLEQLAPSGARLRKRTVKTKHR